MPLRLTPNSISSRHYDISLGKHLLLHQLIILPLDTEFIRLRLIQLVGSTTVHPRLFTYLH